MNFPEVEEWVRRNLPSPPARVLEVGAGEGELARSLRLSGYEVTAIDPKSETPDVLPVALIDLPLPELPLDAAIAVVSLHHVEIGELKRGTYLYRWHLDGSLRSAEEVLVARGELPLTGVRFIAQRRAR